MIGSKVKLRALPLHFLVIFVSFSTIALAHYRVVCELGELAILAQQKNASSSTDSHHEDSSHSEQSGAHSHSDLHSTESHSHSHSSPRPESSQETSPEGDEACCDKATSIDLIFQSYSTPILEQALFEIIKFSVGVLESSVIDAQFYPYRCYLARLTAPPLISLSHIPITVLLI